MEIHYDQIVQSALSKNTREAYQKGWKKFEKFCDGKGLQALPAKPKTVIDFMITQATQPVGRNGRPLSIETIALYRSAINHKHVHSGFASPTSDLEVSLVWRGLKRTDNTPVRQAKALREYEIEKMLKACPDTLIGKRDAAILAIGFSAALRRSEICNLRIDDIDIIKTGNPRTESKMFLLIRKSKTDQEGRGQKIAILKGKNIKPIQRLLEWLQASGIESGYLFQTINRGGTLRGNPLHHSDISRLVKKYAGLIGLDPKTVSGHSLRAGFVTSAAAHGARLDKIMEITRHRSIASVLKYIREADAFKHHAGAKFL